MEIFETQKLEKVCTGLSDSLRRRHVANIEQYAICNGRAKFSCHCTGCIFILRLPLKINLLLAMGEKVC